MLACIPSSTMLITLLCNRESNECNEYREDAHWRMPNNVMYQLCKPATAAACVWPLLSIQPSPVCTYLHMIIIYPAPSYHGLAVHGASWSWEEGFNQLLLGGRREQGCLSAVFRPYVRIASFLCFAFPPSLHTYYPPLFAALISRLTYPFVLLLQKKATYSLNKWSHRKIDSKSAWYPGFIKN